MDILEKFRNIVRFDHPDSHISFGNNHKIITRLDVQKFSYFLGDNYLRFRSHRDFAVHFYRKIKTSHSSILVIKVGKVLQDYQFNL